MSNTTQPIDTNVPGQASAKNAEPGAKIVRGSSRRQTTEQMRQRRREEHQAKMAAMTMEELEAYGREIASIW